MAASTTTTATAYLPAPEYLPTLKRTTCDLCRERKVRCDRAKPECGRCKRNGHTCTYPSPSAEAAKINSALQNLHSRLVQAESRLQEHAIPITAPPSSVATVARNSPVNEVIADGSMDDVDMWDPALFFDGVQDSTSDNTTSCNHSRRPTLEQRPTTGTDDPFSAQLSMAMWNLPSPPDMQALQALQLPLAPLDDPSMHITPTVVDCLILNHFHIVQKHFPLVDSEHFHQETLMSEHAHHKALKNAVMMSGASTDAEFQHMAREFYVRSRYYLEQAETDLNTGLVMNLEAAQALVLIARFEFRQGRVESGLMTTSRLMRLLSLMGHSQFEATDSLHQRALMSGSLSLDGGKRTQSRQRTYMLANVLNLYASSNAVKLVTASDLDVAYSPTSSADSLISQQSGYEVNKTSPSNSLTNAPCSDDDAPIASLASVMKLVIAADRHHTLTAANVAGTGAPEYNFCLAHEELENAIGTVLATIPPESLIKGPYRELRVLSLITVLGAHITLYNTAIVEVQKARFLQPMATESRKIGISTAQSICEILRQPGVLDPTNVRVFAQASLFILRPLAAAAELLLHAAHTGNSSISGSGSLVQNKNTGFYITHNTDSSYTAHDLRQSLQVIVTAYDSFKDDTDIYEPVMRSCRDYLSNNQPIARGRSYF